MPATHHGLSYMLDVDPLSDVAQAIQDLAVSIFDKVGVWASGSVSPAAYATANVTINFHVDFPVGRFDAAPIVTLSLRTTAPTSTRVSFSNVTKDGMDIYYERTVTGVVPVHWQARQGG